MKIRMLFRIYYSFFSDRPEYLDILDDLASQWICNEINHKVSKEASSNFWRIANNMFHRLYVAKGNVGRKIPQFQTLRDRMYQHSVPPVKMEVGFKSKENGEITVVEDATSIPSSRFPRSSFIRLYEIASVDVS